MHTQPNTHVVHTVSHKIHTIVTWLRKFALEQSQEFTLIIAFVFLGAQGFVVCSGMSWWRATSASIEYAQLMHQACGQMCDDQRVLNVFMEQQLKMAWNVDPSDFSLKTRISNKTESDPRFVGLMTQSIHGTSNRIAGLTIKIWHRDFAFRGPLHPNPVCPKSVWVSMPILDTPSRGKAWLTKLESFKQWDDYCASRA